MEKFRIFIGATMLLIAFGINTWRALNNYGISDPNQTLHPQVLAQTNTSGKCFCGAFSGSHSSWCGHSGECSCGAFSSGGAFSFITHAFWCDYWHGASSGSNPCAGTKGNGSGRCYDKDYNDGMFGVERWFCDHTNNPDHKCNQWSVNFTNFGQIIIGSF